MVMLCRELLAGPRLWELHRMGARREPPVGRHSIALGLSEQTVPPVQCEAIAPPLWRETPLREKSMFSLATIYHLYQVLVAQIAGGVLPRRLVPTSCPGVTVRTTMGICWG